MTTINSSPPIDQLVDATGSRTKHSPFVLQTVVLNQANNLLKKTKKEEKEIREIKHLIKKIIAQLKAKMKDLPSGAAALGAINYAIGAMENLVGNIDCKLLVEISNYVTQLTKEQSDMASDEESKLNGDKESISGAKNAALQYATTTYSEHQSTFENALSVLKNFLSQISTYLTNTTSDSQNITKNIQPVIDILTYLTQRLHQ